MSPSHRFRLPFRGRARRFATLLAALCALSSAVMVGSSTLPAQAAPFLPNNVPFEQWNRNTNNWVNGSLNNIYEEGEVVPFRVDVTGVDAGQYQFSICRTFINMGGTAFGYNFLDLYDTTVAPVVGAPETGEVAPVTAAVGGFATIVIDSVNEIGGQGDCNNTTERETIVTFTIGGTPAPGYVLFGGHLAAPTDPGVGVGHGAAQFMGSALHMDLLEPAMALPIMADAQTTGVVTIVKDAIPDTANAFTFTPSPGINGGMGFFLVDDGVAGPPDNTASFTVDPSGPNNPLTVTETAPAIGYVLTGITCSSSVAGDDSSGNVATATATFNVSAGEHVTCVFTNIAPNGALGTLVVQKLLQPGSDPGRFNLLIDGIQFAGNVGDGGTTGAQVVAPGPHTVSETGAEMTDPANYLTTIVCTLPGDPEPVALGFSTSLPNVPVGAGETVTCLITNTRGRGTLRVIKNLVPPADPGLFNLLIDGAVEAADVPGGGDTGAVAVDAGLHTVSETAGAGTNLADYTTSIECTHLVTNDNQVPDVVVVASGPGTSLEGVPVAIGDEVTCIITNIRRPGGPGDGGDDDDDEPYGTDPRALPTERPYDPVPGQPAGDTGQPGATQPQPETSSQDAGSEVAGTTVPVTPVTGPSDRSDNPVLDTVAGVVGTQVNLPRTGAALIQQAMAGLVLTAAGLLLLAVRRRRSPSPSA